MQAIENRLSENRTAAKANGFARAAVKRLGTIVSSVFLLGADHFGRAAGALSVGAAGILLGGSTARERGGNGEGGQGEEQFLHRVGRVCGW